MSLVLTLALQESGVYDFFLYCRLSFLHIFFTKVSLKEITQTLSICIVLNIIRFSEKTYCFKYLIIVAYFSHTIGIADIIKQLIGMLDIEGDYVGPLVLSALTYVGRKGNNHMLLHIYKLSV